MARILIQAIQNGQETLAKDIIMKHGSCGGIDSQTSRRDGTALFFCCSRGYLELAKLLLERGASVGSTDKNLATPLHGAVDNGHLDIVKLLISHGANINAQTFRGDSPLHLAAYRGFGEIARCLVEAGADSRLVNSYSFTPENEAVGRGHHDVCNYIRSTQNARHLPERPVQPFDSLIQLDPPSLTSIAGYQADDDSMQGKAHQLQRHFDAEVERRKLDFRSDTNIRSKSWDYSSEKLNNLSVISLDPPSNISPNGCPTSPRKKLNLRQGPEKLEPSLFLPPLGMTTTSQLSPNNVHSKSPLSANVFSSTPSFFPSSNSHCLSPSLHLNANRSSATSCQFLNPLGGNFCMDSHRRPSTGSTCSCFSELSVGAASDVGSLPSSGSDGSGCYSDARRDEMELLDPQMVTGCSEDPDKDLVLLSMGVRNPPTQNHKRQLSTTSESVESPDFSDIYDSTLFSLSSMSSGPRSVPFNWPNPTSIDFTVAGTDKNYSRLNCFDTNNCRPKLNRATSMNCSCQLPNLTLKVRPDYNKSMSAEFRPNHHLVANQLCPGFDIMPSNDLSSSFSVKEKPSCTMTCVNIPLN